MVVVAALGQCDHPTLFCYVSTDGGAYYYYAYNSRGFAPGFDL